jgi:hypothetical protein
MPAEDASLLREAYKAYRSAAHRQALQKEAGVIPGDQFATNGDRSCGSGENWAKLRFDTPICRSERDELERRGALTIIASRLLLQ